MAYRIDLPNGESVRTDELLVGKVTSYCETYDVPWPVVIDAPVASLQLMAGMYADQCQLRGAGKPGAMTAVALAKKFVQVDPIPDLTEDEEGDPDGDPPPAKS